MNWLWVIVGAGLGAILIRDHFAGLVVGAMLGGLASLLGVARQKMTALERRLSVLERKLAALERVSASTVAASPDETAPATSGQEVKGGEVRAAPAPLIAPASLVPQPPAAIKEDAGVEPVLERPVDIQALEVSANWIDRLLGGNLLAKAGVVLLFFGAASGLKMAADYGLMPPAVRLLFAAVAGVALVLFGHNRAARAGKQAFGLALQGGGFAILYLCCYFAFSRYGLISAVSAFIGFALLGVGCAALAVRQNSPALAWLGMSGAFFAPAMASTGANQYLILFGYFLLLDVFIVAISSRTAWRSLNLMGFAFTALFGFAWAMQRYRPEFRNDIEMFLLLFFLLFTLAPALLALYRKAAVKGWQDGALLFGVPAVAATVQASLGYDRDYLALTAFLAGAYYLALVFMTRRSGNSALPQAFIALSITCLTVAVPLAFGAGVTTVFWALEGAAVLAFGAYQNRKLAVWAGLIIQLLAAWRLVDAGHFLTPATPFLNDVFFGALTISLAAVASAWILYRRQRERPWQALLLAWSVVWWLLTGWNEATLLASYAERPGLLLLWMSLGALALDGFGKKFDWSAGRYAAIALWPVCLASMLMVVDYRGHALTGSMAYALPIAIGAAYWLLRRQQLAGLDAWLKFRHLSLFWLLVLALVVEAGWQAEHWVRAVPVWAPVAMLATICAALAALDWMRAGAIWPVRNLEALYQFEATLPLAAGLVMGVVLLNLNFNGAWNLAYVPLLNPLDAICLLALFFLWKLSATDVWRQRSSHISQPVIATVALLWLTAAWARVVHHYLDVPFGVEAFKHSAIFQAGVSLLWTAFAITAMLAGSRQRLRQVWFAGIALLGVVGVKLLLVDLGQASLATRTATLLGMGGLILLAGYFAPVPPKQESIAT